jgi:orotate phosphoribosyltransferase
MLHDEILGLLAPRTGHFVYESGHHGTLRLLIPRLCLHPRRLRAFAEELARRLAPHGVEAVCGPLVEGALLAQMVAEHLDAEFYYAEQFARSPRDGLYPVGYRIPDALRPIARGKRTAVVDDVVNAGSAIRGAFADLIACDAKPVVIGALLVLGSSGPAFAAGEGVTLESLGQLPSDLWEPSNCPLCASGVAVEGRSVPSRSP